MRNLGQTASAAGYLTTFRNLVIGIPGMNEAEKLDRFVVGLKHEVKLEVLKANPADLNTASQIALNVDNAIYDASFYNRGTFGAGSVPQPMEIGYVEDGPHYRGKAFKNEKKKPKSQREKDVEKNACFSCHKPGCRPWMPTCSALNVSNSTAGNGSVSDSESEN